MGNTNDTEPEKNVMSGIYLSEESYLSLNLRRKLDLIFSNI